ncbi:hypothetical protein CV_0887 [Chromobacterium violaceum ATCC 12472]|uniref:Uncharacterized protein n=1 Tax=Chromobacterium violaceum (strain ATCC 12472 / DSM 30191 / JCM 1249 / CCUG 213 / NBRC 12614 / NCIMB 9131 / NCTC 9757 / MK) TaxID=243365 RepID=Q7NZN5_CHRVO|nr:hypothetical protein CV_0887 [Chromobacterium violaceum ATCC 12472]
MRRNGRDREWRLADCPGRGARLRNGNRQCIACGRLFADFFIVFRYLGWVEQSALDIKQEGVPQRGRPPYE